MEYRDFVIQILPGQDGSFEVRVESSAGRGEGRFEIPAGLESMPGETLTFNVRDLGPVASPPSSAPPSAQAVGEQLFQALFRGKVLTLFHDSFGRAQAEGCGLRIRLRIDPALGAVLALPWELLYRADTGDFLGTSRNTVIVRSLDVHRAVAPVPVDGRLRILAVVAAPRGYDNLDLVREKSNLESAWESRSDAELVFLGKACREELRAALLASPFHVLHFMGHGDFDETRGEGVILLEAPGGDACPVPGPDLAAELKGVDSLGLVVLNACHTAQMAKRSGLHPFAGVASALVQGGIPAVVAMRSRIADQAAVQFSKTFYERLAAEDPVDAAIAEGRLAIQREEKARGGWALPVLFLLGEDGVLFERAPRKPGLLRKWIAAGLGLLVLASFLAIWFLRKEPGTAAAPEKRQEALELNNQGFALADEGKDEEARQAFEAALRIDPQNAPAHDNLARLLEKHGNYTEALVHAQAAAESASGEALYIYNLGSLLSGLGRTEEALPILRRATEIEPCSFKAHNELGNVFLDLDRPADARREIDRGISCSPNFAPLHKNLGRVALSQGKPEEAVRSLEQALSHYPPQDQRGKAEALYWLASAQARMNRGEAACGSLKQLRALAIPAFRFSAEAESLTQQLRCDGVS